MEHRNFGCAPSAHYPEILESSLVIYSIWVIISMHIWSLICKLHLLIEIHSHSTLYILYRSGLSKLSRRGRGGRGRRGRCRGVWSRLPILVTTSPTFDGSPTKLLGVHKIKNCKLLFYGSWNLIIQGKLHCFKRFVIQNIVTGMSFFFSLFLKLKKLFCSVKLWTYYYLNRTEPLLC